MDIDPSRATFLLTDRPLGRTPEMGIPGHSCGCGCSATGTGSPCPRRGVIKEGEGGNWLHADVSSHITNDRDLLNLSRSGWPAAVVRREAISRPGTSGWILAGYTHPAGSRPCRQAYP